MFLDTNNGERGRSRRGGNWYSFLHLCFVGEGVDEAEDIVRVPQEGCCFWGNLVFQLWLVEQYRMSLGVRSQGLHPQELRY